MYGTNCSPIGRRDDPIHISKGALRKQTVGECEKRFSEQTDELLNSNEPIFGNPYKTPHVTPDIGNASGRSVRCLQEPVHYCRETMEGMFHSLKSGAKRLSDFFISSIKDFQLYMQKNGDKIRLCMMSGAFVGMIYGPYGAIAGAMLGLRFATK